MGNQDLGSGKKSSGKVVPCEACGSSAAWFHYGAQTCDSCANMHGNQSTSPSLHLLDMNSDVSDINSPALSNKNEDLLCKVCGSLSTGMHYEVETCEGCKTFFKRNFNKIGKHFCKHASDFKLTRETRNKCKKCRLDKCFEVGMRRPSMVTNTVCAVCGDVPEGVRNGVSACKRCGDFFGKHHNRIFKCEKNKTCIINITNIKTSHSCRFCRLQKCFEVGMKPNYAKKQKKNENVSSDLTTTFKHISQLHIETCAMTKDKADIFMDKPLVFFDMPTTNQPWQHFALQMEIEIQQILSFFQRLSCFDNQPTLASLQKPIFKIYLLRIARVLFPPGLLLQDGRFVRIEILNSLLGEQLVAEMVHFSETIRNLTDGGIAFFIVLVYLKSQDEGNQKLAKEIQATFQQKVSNFDALMDLSDTINQNFHSTVIPWLRQNHNSLKLPKLFSKIFEIP